MRRAWLSVPAVAAAATLIAAAVAVSGSRSPRTEPLPVHWSVPDFTLVDQEGDTLRAADLGGSVWAVNVFFSNCHGVCPRVNARMARVAETLRERGLLGDEMRLVSISVDPARDTPPVLREYARAFGGAPPREWAFLTGSRADKVRRLIQQGFRVTALDPGPDEGEGADGYQVSHSPRILLVDRQGRVRGTYDGREAAATEALLAAAALLLDETIREGAREN